MANLGTMQLGNQVIHIRDLAAITHNELKFLLGNYQTDTSIYLCPIHVNDNTKIIRFPSASITSSYGPNSANYFKLTFSAASNTVTLIDYLALTGSDVTTSSDRTSWEVNFSSSSASWISSATVSSSVPNLVGLTDRFTSISTHVTDSGTGSVPNCMMIIYSNGFIDVDNAINDMINLNTKIPKYIIGGIGINNDEYVPLNTSRRMYNEADFNLLTKTMSRIMNRYLTVDASYPNGVFSEYFLSSISKLSHVDKRYFYGHFDTMNDLDTATTANPPTNDYSVAMVGDSSVDDVMYVYDPASGTWNPYRLNMDMDNSLLLTNFVSSGIPLLGDVMAQYLAACIAGINTGITLNPAPTSTVKLKSLNSLKLNPQQSGNLSKFDLDTPQTLEQIFIAIMSNQTTNRLIFNDTQLVDYLQTHNYLSIPTSQTAIFRYMGTCDTATLIGTKLTDSEASPNEYQIFTVTDLP